MTNTIPETNATLPQALTQRLPKRFMFLRHGQTDWNQQGRVMGQRNIALNATGRAQALRASRQLAGLGLTHVFVSPLERCQATCGVIARALDLDVVTVEALAERNWGDFEGGLSAARHVAFDAPPNGETTRSFHQRVTCGLAEIGSGGFPLIVAHSGVFRALTAQDEHRKVGHAEPIVILVNAHAEQLDRKASAKRLAFQ